VVDSDCEAGNFCNTNLHLCIPQLPNGDPIPTIPGHTPDLDGICTPEVGTIVCVSGVCDTTDNLCGLADGSGDCTDNAQCRSGNCNMASGVCAPELPCCGNTYGANMGSQCVICDDAGVPIDSGADANGGAPDASGDASTIGNTPADGTPQTPGNADNPGSGSSAQPSGKGNSSSGGGCRMGGGAANADLGMMAGLLAMTVGALRRRRAARP
jgi:hypothetical protein